MKLLLFGRPPSIEDGLRTELQITDQNERPYIAASQKKWCQFWLNCGPWAYGQDHHGVNIMQRRGAAYREHLLWRLHFTKCTVKWMRCGLNIVIGIYVLVHGCIWTANIFGVQQELYLFFGNGGIVKHIFVYGIFVLALFRMGLDLSRAVRIRVIIFVLKLWGS